MICDTVGLWSASHAPPPKILEHGGAVGKALGHASALGSVLPDFNYSDIIGVRVATLAHQFQQATSLVPCLVQLGSECRRKAADLSFRSHMALGSVLGSVLGSTWFRNLQVSSRDM